MSLDHIERDTKKKMTGVEALSKELVTQMTEFFEEDEQTLEDGRETKAYFDKIKIVETANLQLIMICIFLSVIQYELEFEEKNARQSKTLLWLVFVSSVMLFVLTPFRYWLMLKFKKKRNLVPPNATLWSTGRWKPLLLELIIIGVHPSPFLYGQKFTMHTMYDNRLIEYHVNDVLGMLLFFRIFAVFKIILIRTYWYSNRAQRVCDLYDCQADFLFVLKCYMRMFPVRSVFIGYFLSIPIFAYWLRISERPYARVTDGLSFNFDSYLNSMWNVIITIGTIGYGDYYAITIFGRFFIFFVCIWGTSVVSLMVVSMTRVLELTYQENRAYNLLQRLRAKIDMKNASAQVFTMLMRYRNSFRPGGNIEHRLKAEVAMNHLKEFKGISRYYKALGEESDSQEMLSRQLDNLKDQMTEINECVEFNVEEKVGQFAGSRRNLGSRSTIRSHTRVPTLKKYSSKNTFSPGLPEEIVPIREASNE